MTAITEGALTFTFPAGALVCKYDEMDFYRQQFSRMGNGIKAMDLAFIEANTLWLIEVKDYRQHPRTKTIPLIDELAAKLRDTLAGLMSARCTAQDLVEKAFAQSAVNADQIRVVLHLEEPAPVGRIAPNRILNVSKIQKMKQRLRSVDADPRVVDLQSLAQYPDMRWTVTG